MCAAHLTQALLLRCSRLMGSDAFRSLFILYQSRTRVAMHIETLREGDTEYTGDAEGKAVRAAAFAAPSFAGVHAQVGSCSMSTPARTAGLCEINCVTMCCMLHPAF